MSISIGTRIKELRTLFNMSQEELGNRVGVQRAAINKYEKGTVENIPIKTLEKIAIAFDVSPSYLVGWSDTASNPLSVEVKVIQGVERFFGVDSVNLLETYTQLTPQGKKRVIQYIEDMAVIYGDCKVEN